MSPKSLSEDEILRAALKKEENAYAFYDRLLQSSGVEFIRELLVTLRDEEAKHIRLIKDKLARLNAGRG